MLTVRSGRQTLDWLLTEKRIGVYVGVDPTAPSLHVGHLLPLMALYWMYLHGYYTVSLVSDMHQYMHDIRLIWDSWVEALFRLEIPRGEPLPVRDRAQMCKP